MPYIKQEKRDQLEPIIEELLTKLREMQSDDPLDNPQANISYVVSTILDRMYVSDYQEMVNALGMLMSVIFEYYRRVGTPYENQKAFDNGDVYKSTTAQDAVEQYVEDNG